MSVVVVTDTDVAAIPFALHGNNYSFCLDKENKGPFVAMLPLSHILDASKERECIQSFREQFEAIPYTNISTVFLKYNSPHYIAETLNKVGSEAKKQKAVELFLDDILKDNAVQSDAEQNFIFFLNLAVPGFSSAKTGSEAIEFYAKQKNIASQEALADIQRIAQDNKLAIGIQSKYSDPQCKKAYHDAAASVARDFLGGFGELPDSIAKSLSNENKGALRDAVSIFLGSQTPTPEQNEALLDKIITYADDYHIRPPVFGSETAFDLVKNPFQSQAQKYKLDDIKCIRELALDPEESARKHYHSLRKTALAQDIKPLKAITIDQINAVKKGLTSCPAFIANRANATHMKIALIDDKVDIGSIVSGVGLAEGTYSGRSTGKGVYVNSTLLNNPDLLREEIIHEVEQGVVPWKTLPEYFSLQQPWMKAVCRDTAEGKGNPLYQWVLKNTQEFLIKNIGIAKGNAALVPGAVFTPVDPHTTTDVAEMQSFTEALPDLSHIAAMVEEKLAKDKVIKIGANMIGLGGQRYKSVEEVMQAALPNIWLMYEGAPEGMKLVQSSDGNVEAIGARINPPAGTTKVISLKEYCERPMIKNTDRIKQSESLEAMPTSDRQFTNTLSQVKSNIGNSTEILR